MLKRTLSCLAVGVAMALSPTAQAHFLWVVTETVNEAPTVKVYFGEEAIPDDPDLLDRVAKAEAWLVGGRRGEPRPLTLTVSREASALVAELPEGTADSPVILRHTFGVMSRGGQSFRLNYYAKSATSPLPGTWNAIGDKERLPLEIVPQADGSAVVFKVLWQGTPVPNAEVTIDGPGLNESVKGETNDQGLYRRELPQTGLYSIRARMVDETAGELDGKSYASSRHYSTLTLPYAPPRTSPVSHNWPELPKGTTSFGAAVVGDSLYVYGGNYGGGHQYSKELQSGDLWRLNLQSPEKWEQLTGGPRRTGLAMVEHGGQLYRVGGFEVKNSEGEVDDLWSQSDFARFDPATGKWEELPALPEGRSSHDVAVVGDVLYVVGGWKMEGQGNTQWHETAWAVDLSADKLEWKPITAPPFQRRAVSLAAWQNKLYVIGGMQQRGGTTTKTAVYDPQLNTWSAGPSLLGGGMDGFGTAAFACDGDLYVTTMSGSVQRLAGKGTEWELVGQLEHPRFFHRILPWQPKELVIVGGASMTMGKVEALERLPVK